MRRPDRSPGLCERRSVVGDDEVGGEPDLVRLAPQRAVRGRCSVPVESVIHPLWWRRQRAGISIEASVLGYNGFRPSPRSCCAMSLELFSAEEHQKRLDFEQRPDHCHVGRRHTPT
jgi:hypothetical protein